MIQKQTDRVNQLLNFIINATDYNCDSLVYIHKYTMNESHKKCEWVIQFEHNHHWLQLQLKNIHTSTYMA